MTASIAYGPPIRARKKPKPRKPIAPCGTYGGYQRHYKTNEDVCDACRHAATVYQGQYRARNGKTKHALVSYEVLGLLLAAAPMVYLGWTEPYWVELVSPTGLTGVCVHEREVSNR